MIEKFTRAELLILAQELKENKHLIMNYRKSDLLKDVLRGKGFKSPTDFWELFPGYQEDLRKAIYNLADNMTGNFDGINPKSAKPKEESKVSPEMADKYADALSNVIDVLMQSKGVKKKRGRKPNGR